MLERTSGLLAVDDRLKDDIEQGYSVLLGEKVALDSARQLILTRGYMPAEKVIREYLLVSTDGNWYLALEMGGDTYWTDMTAKEARVWREWDPPEHDDGPPF